MGGSCWRCCAVWVLVGGWRERGTWHEEEEESSSLFCQCVGKCTEAKQTEEGRGCLFHLLQRGAGRPGSRVGWSEGCGEGWEEEGGAWARSPLAHAGYCPFQR